MCILMKMAIFDTFSEKHPKNRGVFLDKL